MKKLRWIIASMFAGLLATACAAPVASEEEVSSPQEESVGEAAEALSIKSTIYYAEPAHLTQVGYCVFSTCPPKGTTCSGTKTAYYEVFIDPCD